MLFGSAAATYSVRPSSSQREDEVLAGDRLGDQFEDARRGGVERPAAAARIAPRASSSARCCAPCRWMSLGIMGEPGIHHRGTKGHRGHEAETES